MASKRRGGFRPPELRGTLGTLLRTTTDAVRGALERGAREGRARFDDARAHRRRQDALIELGELVLDLIRRGEIDLAELPEARDLIRQLDELDVEPAGDPEPELPRAPSRSRFDDRPRRAAPATAPDADDSGTVSSGASLRSTRPTTPARPRDTESATSRATTKPIKGAGRRDLAPDAPAARDTPTAPAAPAAPSRRAPAERPAPIPDPPPPDRPPALWRSALPPDPHRKGGISFDDDDLNEYMHPDDVPPKGPPRNPGDGEA